MKVLVTGATGFIGKNLTRQLAQHSKHNVLAVVRSTQLDRNVDVPLIAVEDISEATDWTEALIGIDVVIHLAGRAHVLNDNEAEALKAFRQVNVEGAEALAKQSLAAGVKRFIFISSIGVNGSSTISPFDETSSASPHADYAHSKFEAELKIGELLHGTAMELVIIRPPLVYAGHAPGNFSRLLKLVASGVPLPFGAVKNQRSMIALENVVDFITLCVDHPSTANQLFLVSDGDDVSTAEIVKYLAEGMGRKARLLPIPVGLMKFSAAAVGKKAMFEQLCGSLEINSSKARDLLGWQPPLSAAEALIKAGKDYRNFQK